MSTDAYLYGPGIVHSQRSPCSTSICLYPLYPWSETRAATHKTDCWFWTQSAPGYLPAAAAAVSSFQRGLREFWWIDFSVERKLRDEKEPKWRIKRSPCCVCKCSLLLCGGERGGETWKETFDPLAQSLHRSSGEESNQFTWTGKCYHLGS